MGTAVGDSETALAALAKQQADVREEIDLTIREIKTLKDVMDLSAAVDRLTVDLDRMGEASKAAGLGADADQLARTQALQARAEAIASVFKDVFSGVNQALSGMVQGVLQGTQTVSEAFERMAENVITSISERMIQRGLKVAEEAILSIIEKLVMAGLSAWSGSATASAGLPGGGSIDTTGFSLGFDSRLTVPQYATGGIITRPTVALVGESEPEAVIPLDRLSQDAAAPAVQVNIIDQRKSGNIEQREGEDASGQPQLDVIITDVVRGGIQSGAYDRAMGSTFGLQRRGTTR
jgi:hypothetical protein